jgi:transposase
LTIKPHASCDALGNPTGFFLTSRQAHDLEGANALPEITADRVIADKAYDAEQQVIQKLQTARRW